MTGLRG